MPIQILPDALVARIAAGEVVERPSSVVKEMVENAIDAGATDIRVECAEGGRRLIRITDNGHGIRSDEVALAFAHHATSKLSNADDLVHIHTLGFRGEALASIASVSQVTCVTRHKDETSGTIIRLDNGKISTQERIGRTHGTTMTVEHLFSRVPARLKFLKSIQTERGHIDGIVMRYAMAYPHIRFSLTHDGKVTFQSLGNNSLRDVMVEVYGADAAEKMVTIEKKDEVTAEVSQVTGTQDTLDTSDTATDTSTRTSSFIAHPSYVVTGYAALPELTHGNRTKIIVFVNGRPVQDSKLTYAVVQAYHTLLMVGRYPIAVVMIQVPAEDVDVNVHPAKAEVRFRDGDGVFSAVQRALRRTLLANMPVPEAPSVLGRGETTDDGRPTTDIVGLSFGAAQPFEAANAETIAPTQPALAGSERWDRVGIARGYSSFEPAPHTPNVNPSTRPLTDPTRPHEAANVGQPQTVVRRPLSGVSPLPALRILGQLALTYIIAEGPEGLYLIDQHASHERILFERLLAQRELGAVFSQALLDPVPVQIPADSAYLLEGQLPMLSDLGFEVDHFGGNTFLVRAVPALMIQDDITNAVREIVADLESGDAPLRKDLEARVLRRVCKRMAIKAGRVLPMAEMAALVRDLEACESPRTCPHGRPTIIQISVSHLEREFGRLGA